MASNPATEIASALQSASLKRHPSPSHDINPSTAASLKVPAEIQSPKSARSLSSATSTIPSDIVRPAPRRKSFPAIPDFRFEQSYLASIKNAQTWSQVAYITTRDQVLMPLTQGVVWNLLQFGWKFWNRGSQLRGQSVGARVRRWWWSVNNWKLPEERSSGEFRSKVEDVR